MMRNRRKRQRTVRFEALEGRLALSIGMGVASPHLHAAIVRTAQRSIPAAFTGHVSTNGSTLTTTNLRGHIGPDRFTGSGTGTEVGTQFQGGEVSLSNSRGTIQLQLGPFYADRVGKVTTQTFGITVVSATGRYAPYLTSAGHITRWSVPARAGAMASFAAVFTL
jgi:hypothetical protein